MGLSNDKLHISNRLRVLRAEKGLTQEELAEKVGVTRVTINCIENDVYHPSLELAFKLSRFFSRPIEEIFVLKEERK